MMNYPNPYVAYQYTPNNWGPYGPTPLNQTFINNNMVIMQHH